MDVTLVCKLCGEVLMYTTRDGVRGLVCVTLGCNDDSIVIETVSARNFTLQGAMGGKGAVSKRKGGGILNKKGGT